ncbi:hypothetical protein TNCV_957411 [Trichonephila clavipes]|nr:hypothetical protein TNCV_957411 [Trichonephila clavipes]
MPGYAVFLLFILLGVFGSTEIVCTSSQNLHNLLRHPHYAERHQHSLHTHSQSIPVPTDNVVSRVFIKSSSLEQGSPSILAWPQSGQASLAAKPVEVYSQKSCPMVRRKQATTLIFSRCLGIGPTLARVSQGSCQGLGHDSIIVNECGNNMLFALLKVKGTSG